MSEINTVEMWEEDIIIPTYPVAEPNKNPMFLDKRVYQGSSGKVYPHSVIDKIYDEKIDRTYHGVFLENQYLKIMILPELGGRIQRATDKTNNYDFVYYNHVIKPALVGLAGPWLSGGIEFNWPQHHRPSTFDPIDYKLECNPDGSCTVWVSEIENMFRTKGMIGFTLYPDKAYIEIKAQLYNRTSVPQTFLWWANPAIPVNDYTQSIFPPDVHAVMDHGKRDVSTFPIATGTYYKMDYSSGVDISRYRNIPVPTSYMAYHSEYNFVGGYDYREKAGILHVADHHISPGKKQWTWGCGEFGQAWDRNLTDEDGPYIELMTGCFTDNQPDFTWMAPYEEKKFTQYFMPYKEVGMIKNATIDGAVNLTLESGKVSLTVYTTSKYENARILVRTKGKLYLNETVTLSPNDTYINSFAVSSDVTEEDLKIIVLDSHQKELVSYQAKPERIEKIPEPAKEAPLPKDVLTTEDLYLYGLHIEQYRHATYEAEDYYLEGLRRDSTDIRLNNAYGSLLFRRGCFAESEKHFSKAVEKWKRSNPNPYDGEPIYNLGLSLKYQGKLSLAYDAFFKSTWNGAWQDSGFYQVACIDCINGDYRLALEHIERSIIRNYHNTKARNLKTAILRKLGRFYEAKLFAEETLKIDILDFNSRNERALLAMEQEDTETAKAILAELGRLLHGNHNTYIELAVDYSEAGFYIEAITLLKQYIDERSNEKAVYPLVYYYISYNTALLGNEEKAKEYGRLGNDTCSNGCFPHRLDDIIVLEKVISLCTDLDKAYYYIGNLWYDKKQYEKAIRNWEQSRALDATFPTVHRNISLAYYNKKNMVSQAVESLKRAFELDQTDSRVLMELDQIYKKTGLPHKQRLKFLEKHMELVLERDDLYLEYITLNNLLGEYEKAKQLIEDHKFHPWEGGEGKVSAQYIYSYMELGKKALAQGNYEKAIELFTTVSGPYPHNLGEGKLHGAQENHIYYYLGCAYEKINDSVKATECFIKASEGLSEPVGMMYYNDQPPEMIFYQGMALLKLNRLSEANGRFNKLIRYGEEHIYDKMKIDYFAVSLPDLQIFVEDLNKKNQVHCKFMVGLGYLGNGEMEKSIQCFETVLKLDINHLGVRQFMGNMISIE